MALKLSLLSLSFFVWMSLILFIGPTDARQKSSSKSNEKNKAFQSPHPALIGRKGNEITRESISQILIQSWSHLCQDCEFVIRSLSLPQIPSSVKQRSWFLSPVSSLPRGSFSVHLRFDKDQEGKTSSRSFGSRFVALKSSQKKIFWIHGKADVYKKVPILKQVLLPHQRIEKGDFEYSLQNVNFYSKRAVLQPNQIKGRKLRFNLRPGDIIWKDSLLREKALKKGERVEIQLVNQNWQILLFGQAQQDGYIGDKVKVLNPKTKKSILALVVEKGKVLVFP